MRSTLLKVPVATSTIARFRGVDAWWIPGVSRKIIWAGCGSPRFLIPIIRFRVVCGLCVVMAIRSPTIAFKRVDFPTLGLPMMAIKPDLNISDSENG